jgi:hypothetical protein
MRKLGPPADSYVKMRTNPRDDGEKWVRKAEYIITTPAADAEFALKENCQSRH